VRLPRVPPGVYGAVVSPFAEVRLITGRELRKNFRSSKGVVLAVLSLAGGAGASILFAWMDRVRREQLPPDVDVRTLQEQAFTRLYGADTGKALADCPYSLWMMLVATLWLSPLLVALMGFDSVSGDLQYRSVRFWTVRTRRSSYILGKLLGAWLAVILVTFGMNLIVWGTTMAVGHLAPGPVLAWGLHFFVMSIPITAAWCGIAMLVGSQFRTPMLALLVICAAFFALWLARVVAGFAGVPSLLYAYPNAYDQWFLSPRPVDAARALIGTGVIEVVTATASVLIFERRDLL
jgi:ABC-type transport system involved in multi-copper enzyme maturation permease subunit